ncbi:MAG: hypothetical protein HY902_13955 [Deltaproteobacteria bacterium]|nr:hypothetical protein [Deltaproteobacteria bacterium]
MRRVLAIWLLALAALAVPAAAQSARAPAAAATETARESEAFELRVALHDVDAERRAPLEKISREAVESVQAYLAQPFVGRLDLDFVGSDEAFSEVMKDHGVQGWDERWLAGLALLEQHRIIVAVNGTRALTTRETLEHELVHAGLHQSGTGQWLPRWYQEGVATLLAGEATWERMRDMAGAAPLGQLANLSALDQGFRGSQVAVERAYAMSAGFLRFCTQRAGGQHMVGQLQQRLRQGIGFDSAFALTFGGRPEALYAAYAEQVQASASSWAMLLSDTTVWSLVSLLALFSMVQAWRHRPRFDEDDEPLDLEAIAAEGLAAQRRPWQYRDFLANPLEPAAEGPAGDRPPVPTEPAADTAEDGWIAPETRLRPWHVRDFAAEPLQVPASPANGEDPGQAATAATNSQDDSQITDPQARRTAD